MMHEFRGRQNFVRVDIGANSEGKTPTQIYDLIAYQKAFPWKKIIVSEGQGKFRDAHDRRDLRIDFFIKKTNEDWAGEKQNGLQEYTEPKPGVRVYRFAHSCWVVDDLKLLLPGNDTPGDVLGLFFLRPAPNFNMDMMFSFHEPRNIIEGLKGYPTHYHIYKNNADQKQFIDKMLACHQAAWKATLIVNEYARLYPGHYDVETHTPYFPHIIVEKDKPFPLQYVNMDTEKLKPILEFHNRKNK